MARTQGILDWFRSPESNTLHPVLWDYVESDLFSNGAIGRWTLIRVSYKFRKVAFRNYREDPVVLRSTGGAAAMI
jgi:hypothetical protein